MRSPRDFIARPVDGKRYSNTKLVDDTELILSVSEEDTGIPIDRQRY